MWNFIKSAVQFVLMPVMIPWLHQKVMITKKDKERADLIKVLATEAAEMAMQKWPNKPSTDLVALIVDNVAATLPTNSRTVAYRAAWAAVRRAVAAAKS